MVIVIAKSVDLLDAHAFPTRRSSDLRSKQKRTMADMRSIATAWEARATDTNRYNAAGAISLPTVAVGISRIQVITSVTQRHRLPSTDWKRNTWNFAVAQAAGH